MQKVNAKNRDKIFLFVGRLEKEKWVDILLKILDDKRNTAGDWKWHIFWDGSFFDALKKRESNKIIVHGNVSTKILNTFFKKASLTFMPSRFLETFGLVALESLSNGTPVCGFAKGGLADMIPPSLTIDEAHPIDSFFEKAQNNHFELIDTEPFSYQTWEKNLIKHTKGTKKILLISDYISRIGGAETYTINLKNSLESIGKTVRIIGCKKSPSPLMRKLLFLMTPFAFWRAQKIKTEVRTFGPDLIWCGTITRYIGPWGARVIAKDRNSKKYITHHDIGLICPRPSKIYHETQIPKSLTLSSWLRWERNILSILLILGKWLYVQWIWRYIRTFDIHLLPSKWIKKHLPRNVERKVFEHTIFEEEKT